MIEFTQHALEQMANRSIGKDLVLQAISQPKEKHVLLDYVIFHYLYHEDGKDYLLRVFVNEHVNPNRIITVYRTSKIDKYYES